MRNRPTLIERRRGVTLLEVATALSLCATMMASSFVVLRSAYAAWEAHETDLVNAGSAAAVLRHLVRETRQSRGVVELTAASDTSGALTVQKHDGSTYRWDHGGTALTLSVDSGTAQPLADGVQQFSVVGYEADGVTPTTVPENVQAVRAVLVTASPTGGTRTTSSFTWIRSW